MQFVHVSSVPLSQLWAEEFDPSQWTILLFWSALSTSLGNVLAPLANYGGSLPPLPPLNHPLAIWSPPPPVLTEEPRSDCFSTDDQTIGTLARTLSDRLSAKGASMRTPSRKSSVRSASSVNRLSAGDASLVPSISAERFESEHVEPSDPDHVLIEDP